MQKGYEEYCPIPQDEVIANGNTSYGTTNVGGYQYTSGMGQAPRSGPTVPPTGIRPGHGSPGRTGPVRRPFSQCGRELLKFGFNGMVTIGALAGAIGGGPLSGPLAVGAVGAFGLTLEAQHDFVRCRQGY